MQSWPWQLGVRRSFDEIAAVETIKCTLTSTRMGLQMVWGGRMARGEALCASDWKMARRQRRYIATKLTVAKASSASPWWEREREWEQRGEPKRNEGSSTSWQSWRFLWPNWWGQHQRTTTRWCRQPKPYRPRRRFKSAIRARCRWLTARVWPSISPNPARFSENRSRQGCSATWDLQVCLHEFGPVWPIFQTIDLQIGVRWNWKLVYDLGYF
jgi:hypothetical protein